VRIHVIGVGTERGDDAAGLAVVEALAQAALPPGVSLHRCERPMPDLLDALDGADAAIVVDAARTGAPPGAVLRIARSELARALAPSSHALGVAEALALADALGRAPARIEVVGLEIAEPRGSGLTPAARAGVAAAAHAALEIAREIHEFDRDDCCDA
jgi:hydrogenase maturation protease